EQERHCGLISATPGNPFPPSLKKIRGLLFIESLECDVFSLQPAAQINHESDFVARRQPAVALFSEQSSKVLQMGSQRIVSRTVDRAWPPEGGFAFCCSHNSVENNRAEVNDVMFSREVGAFRAPPPIRVSSKDYDQPEHIPPNSASVS